MKPRHILALVLLGMVVYLVRFYAVSLPTLSAATGAASFRFDVFALAAHPDVLLEAWFGSPPQLSFLDRLPVLVIAAAILAWAALLGWLVLVLLRVTEPLTFLERLVFSLAIGLNAVSSYVLFIGLIGGLNRLWTFGLPAAVTMAVAWLVWRRTFAGRITPSRNLDALTYRRPHPVEQEPHREILGGGWLWLAAPFIVVILLGGMLPPVEFDVREYHLQAPKEFYQDGRIGFLPHNAYGNMAMGTEMHSLLGMVLAGDWWLGALAGKTVIALFAPLTALALYAGGRRFLSRTAGVVAAVIYISTTWIVQVSNYGMVEGALGLYLLLAVYAILLRMTPEQRRPEAGRPFQAHRTVRRPIQADARNGVRMESLTLVAGYFAGAAAATKYSAVLFVLLPLTAWLAFTQVRALGRTSWKPLVAFAMAAAVGCGLWFVKNWALTGNPTYPLAYTVFGGKTWTAEKNALWNRVHQPHEFSIDALATDLGRVLVSSEWHHPLLVPLAVLAFLAPGRRRLAIGLGTYFGFVIAAWWLFALRADRHWIAALPLLALLAGAGACWSQDRVWRWMLMTVLVFTFVPDFLFAAGVPLAGGYNRYFVSLERLRTDPARVDPWHRYFNRHVEHGRVLLVGEAQVFDLEPPILYNTCFDDSYFERLTKNRTTDEIREQLREWGVSHVFVHWGEIERYRTTGYGRWDFVEPEQFDRLVEQGILEPLPDIPGHPGRGYRVLESRPYSRSKPEA